MVPYKVCCIRSAEEVARAVGLVGPMPSGPGVLTLEQIADICSALRSGADYALDEARLSVWTTALGGFSA